MEIESTFNWEEVMHRDILIKRLGKSDLSQPSASIGTTVVCNIACFLLKPFEIVCDSAENLSIDLADRKEESKPFENLEKERYKIGKGDLIPALELGLRHSRIGDRFLLRANSRFAFGYNGRDISIPPNADLHFDIHVLNHIQESEIDNDYVHIQISSILSLNNGKFNVCLPEDIDADIVSHSNRWAAFSDLCFRKEAGNRWFKYKDFQRAARAYAEGTKVADEYFKSIDKYQENKNDMIKMDENGQMQINPDYRGGEGNIDGDSAHEENDGKDSIIFLAYVSCLNNLAACHMEQGENLKARDLCIKVLEIDPSNLKALLRAARSSLALHNFEECEVCITRLLQVDPDNKAGKAEQAKLKKARRDYATKSREISKNIANKLFSSSSSLSLSSDARKQAVLEKGVSIQVSNGGNGGKGIMGSSAQEEKAVDENLEESGRVQEAARVQIADGKDRNEGGSIDAFGKDTLIAGKETATTTVATTTISSSLPFLYLVVTSAAVLVISLLIAVYISYNN